LSGRIEAASCQLNTAPVDTLAHGPLINQITVKIERCVAFFSAKQTLEKLARARLLFFVEFFARLVQRLRYIAARDPDAIVALFPWDHYVSELTNS